MPLNWRTDEMMFFWAPMAEESEQHHDFSPLFHLSSAPVVVGTA
jgi:hypothetical protein